MNFPTFTRTDALRGQVADVLGVKNRKNIRKRYCGKHLVRLTVSALSATNEVRGHHRHLIDN
ncbi:hypothetical protein RvY_04432 [Ramazzottius varieornatus]|uniref:Uncharacterized protein n=1 Tax=Ramazzottius varieornatus TaxID=947166 RepID=A0A1D1V1K3_RAMVA|nr:hypothetical protein RvY_04432 [Ramazzottius varieornatus]